MGKGVKNKVPERWEDYTNMGRQIPGTRFITFKVPLKAALLNRLDHSVDPFDPRAVTDHCSSLGLVIDLTNTDRYYDPKYFLNLGISHRKLFLAGHVIPKKKTIDKFFQVVETFLEENKGNDKLIGVHCTHGVNRTGYIICRYMIEQLGVPPDQAIADFNSARGHEIERMNYLNDLRMASWVDNSNISMVSKTPRFSNRSTPSGGVGYTRSARSRSRSNLRSPDVSFDLDESIGSHSRRRSNSLPNSIRSRLPSLSTPNEKRASRSRKRPVDTIFDDDTEEEPPSKAFKSPKFGKLYYEQYYKGAVLPQYDMDFYSRRAGGGGPCRVAKAPTPPTRGKSGKPRKYRGPRPYKSPGNEDEAEISGSRGKFSSKELLSPDQGSSGVTPDIDQGRRRSSRRFQPY